MSEGFLLNCGDSYIQIWQKEYLWHTIYYWLVSWDKYCKNKKYITFFEFLSTYSATIANGASCEWWLKQVFINLSWWSILMYIMLYSEAISYLWKRSRFYSGVLKKDHSQKTFNVIRIIWIYLAVWFNISYNYICIISGPLNDSRTQTWSNMFSLIQIFQSVLTGIYYFKNYPMLAVHHDHLVLCYIYKKNHVRANFFPSFIMIFCARW